MPAISRITLLGLLALLGGKARAAPRPACDPAPKLVLAAALRTARLAPGRGARMRRRLRWSALLPRLSARIGGLRGQGLSYDLTPGDRGLDGRSSSALRWEVHLVWDLGRLAYDQRELHLLRERRRAAQARRKVVATTLALYYARRAARRGPASSERFERLSAELDALTGGLLTRVCARHTARSALAGSRLGAPAAKGLSPNERGAQKTPTLRRRAAERARRRQ